MFGSKKWKVQGNKENAEKLEAFHAQAVTHGFKIAGPIGYNINRPHFTASSREDSSSYLFLAIPKWSGNEYESLPGEWTQSYQGSQDYAIRLNPREKPIMSLLKELDSAGVPLPPCKGLENAVVGVGNSRFLNLMSSFNNLGDERMSHLLRHEKGLFSPLFDDKVSSGNVSPYVKRYLGLVNDVVVSSAKIDGNVVNYWLSVHLSGSDFVLFSKPSIYLPAFLVPADMPEFPFRLDEVHTVSQNGIAGCSKVESARVKGNIANYKIRTFKRSSMSPEEITTILLDDTPGMISECTANSLEEMEQIAAWFYSQAANPNAVPLSA